MGLLRDLKSVGQVLDRVESLEAALREQQSKLKYLDDDLDHLADKVQKFTGRQRKRDQRENPAQDGDDVLDLNERIKKGMAI